MGPLCPCPNSKKPMKKLRIRLVKILSLSPSLNKQSILVARAQPHSKAGAD
ncbi:unnamed protein product [Staurois parvus]|uniref:Uncharacterized protein n=1 Tax=Staurois parvus TaxID=386267 RepID=A0ABN9A7A3_9NEOB|nr:unnamed protein product [Staurois parvus]